MLKFLYGDPFMIKTPGKSQGLENDVVKLQKQVEILQQENHALKVQLRKGAHEKSCIKNYLSNNLMDMVFILDIGVDDNACRILDVNQNALDVLDYSKADLLNSRPADIIELFNTDEFKRRDYVLQLKEHKKLYETRINHRTGKKIHVEMYSQAVNYEEKQALIAILRDITERKLQEKALRDTIKRNQLVKAAGKVGIWEWEINTKKIHVSPMLKTLLGYGVSELPNDIDYWGEFVHPDDQKHVHQLINDYLEKKTSHFEATHRMVHKSGEILWFLARGILEQDENGQWTRMIGTETDISESIRLKQELEERELLFRTFFENLTFGTCIFKTKNVSKYAIVNQSLADFLGYTKSELESLPLHEMLELVSDPKDLNREKAYVQKLLSGESDEYHIEKAHVTKTGKKVFGDIYTKIVKDKSGNDLISFTTIQDITRKKEIEKQLLFNTEVERLQREFSEQLVVNPSENFDDIIQHGLGKIGKLLQVDRVYVFQNNDNAQQTSNTHEWRQEGIESQLANSQNISFDSIPAWQQTINAFEPIIISSVEDLPKHWKKEQAIFQDQSIQSLVAVPIYSAHQILGFIGMDAVKEKRVWKDVEIRILKNIGNIIGNALLRKHILEALAFSEKRFRDFFEKIPLGTAIISNINKPCVVNKALADFLEIEKSQLEELTAIQIATQFSCPDDLQTEKQFVMDVLNDKKKVVSLQKRYCTKSGKTKYGYFVCTVIDTPDSIKKTLLMVVQDITDQKKYEQEKEELSHQLIVSQKMEALGTLSGGIAHDFNNILSMILGYAELTREKLKIMDQNTDDTDNHMRKIILAVNRAKDLVRQILDFSRKGDHQMVPLNLKDIIKEMVTLLKSTIPVGISVNVNFEAKHNEIMGDATKVHQILLNLCTNAIQAMENDEGTLTLSLKNEVLTKPIELLAQPFNEGKYLKLTVEDTGCGIDPEIVERIFEPYYTTKDKSKGTGLGLSVAFGSIKKHNGIIDVETRLDQGTRFNVYFPVINEYSQTVTEKLDQEFAEGQGHILVVDDEEMITEMALQMLQQHGYKVTIDSDSISALGRIKKHPKKFDLLLCDYTMPNMTGDNLAKAAKLMNPEMPVVLMSGYTGLKSSKDILDYGVNKVLYKPFEKHELLQALAEVLQHSEKNP